MKKKRQLVMNEAQHRGLKTLAARHGCFQGEMIGFLVGFIESGNEHTNIQVNEIFEIFIEKIGKKGCWLNEN